MRLLYLLGWGYISVSALLVYQVMRPEPYLPIEEVAMPAPAHGAAAPAPAQSWFERVRPHCNPVEVEVTMRSDPPPSDFENQAYAAACYALAGKIEKSAERIEALQGEQRTHAANIVFNAGHGIADAGDDESAGPIMELVLRYIPKHYMALYHAGMAEYRLGQYDQAKQNLQSFLAVYSPDDGWRASARSTLKLMGALEPA